MDTNIIAGCVIVGCALSAIAVLTFWSRRRINRIADNGYRTVRQTLKGLNGNK